MFVSQQPKLKPDESSTSQHFNPGSSTSRPLTSSDKAKASQAHPSKHKSQTNPSTNQLLQQKGAKPGHASSNHPSSQPHKHHIPGKHSTHPQQSSVHGSARQDSKLLQHSRSTLHHHHPKPSNTSSSSGGRIPSKALVKDEHHKHKPGPEVKHSNSMQSKHHPHVSHHHHHHQAAPGHIPNAAKPTDMANKHRLAAGVTGDHKHRTTTGNHDGRHHNPLKRAHPGDNMDMKRIKMEHPSTLPPLPAEPPSPVHQSSSFHIPPLPTQMDSMSLPPLPPPLPADPPPNIWGREYTPPPPPPPN